MTFKGRLSIKEDAQRVFRVLLNRGVAIIPSNVGYAVIATDPEALNRIFTAKRRQSHKKHAMIGSYALHREVQNLPPYEEDMVRLLTVDLDLPLGVVASYHVDHPMIKMLSPATLQQSSIEGTLAMLVNGGQLQDEISRLVMQEGIPLLGSSANLTETGTKVTVEDIDSEIRGISDIIIDHGRQKYSHPRPSSTIIDFKNRRLLRYGACYDVVQDAMSRFYGIDLPNDPGKTTLFSGHISPTGQHWQ